MNERKVFVTYEIPEKDIPCLKTFLNIDQCQDNNKENIGCQ